MAGGYGSFVAMYTAISLGGIAWRINSVLQKLLPGISVDKKAFDPIDTARLLQSLLQSSLTIVLLANLLVNFFVVLALCMKTIFFGTLTLLETQKVVERMINYVLFKGLFLTWVVQPEMMQIALWLAWFAMLGFLKMFQGLARDRLDRLNASPTATVYAHLRVFSVLVLVFLSDLFWIQLCLVVFKDTGISTFMLLLFEPLSIAFETVQAVLVHGMQLLDTWQRQSPEAFSSFLGSQSSSDRSAAGASWEWKGMVIRNFSFAMDLLSLFLALGHCLHIWWLRGLAFQVVDAILFLNLRALLSAILKRIKGFMRMRTAMSTLQGALPDASQDELLAYDDDCAICKEPMAKAKRLPCAHLFHLSCLRSWLDQGLADTYSCPTCRRPLFMGNLRTSLGRSHQARTNQHIAASTWRDSGAESDWITRAGQSSSSENAAGNSRSLGRLELMMRHFSGSGTSQVRQASGSSGEGSPSLATAPRGLTRIELIMRQISFSRSHQQSQTQPSNGWSFWPFSSSASAPPSSQPQAQFGQIEAVPDSRATSAAARGLSPEAQMTAMVSMVREVLPHVSDDRILQDLRRTNCVTTTVNNLL